MVPSQEQGFEADLLQGDGSTGHHAGTRRDEGLQMDQGRLFSLDQGDGNPARPDGFDGFLQAVRCREDIVGHRIFSFEKWKEE
jgi:hypothetical protein